MMTEIYKNHFLATLDDTDEKEKITTFVNELWQDYIGAYYEGKAEGLEIMAKIIVMRGEE